jgi:formylglycine-generating enzyme
VGAVLSTTDVIIPLLLSVAATVLLVMIVRRRIGNVGTRNTLSENVSASGSSLVMPSVLDLKWVRIEAGTFKMGGPRSDDDLDPAEFETPPHTVALTRPFKICAVPVTRAQFATFVGATRYKCSVERGGRSLCWSQRKITRGVTWRNSPGDPVIFPVNRVSWEDAVAFCQWATAQRGKKVRLPSEAEWEYACRAGTTTPFAGTGNLDDMGWYAGNSGRLPLDCLAVLAKGTRAAVTAIAARHCQLHGVGLKKPNAWGLYDMHGNVWEWCSDAYEPRLPVAPATDPTGPVIANPEWRVMRGGQWADIPETCSSSNRGYFRPRDTFDVFSFRVVEEID